MNRRRDQLHLVTTAVFLLLPLSLRAETKVPSGDLAAVKKTIAGLKGKPALVNFWATWCKPCIYELPMLVKLHEDYSKKGVRFYSFSLDGFIFDEAESQVRLSEMLAKVKLPFPVMLAKTDAESLMAAFKLTGMIPATLFLDARGNVTGTWEGVLDDVEARARLDKLLASSKANSTKP